MLEMSNPVLWGKIIGDNLHEMSYPGFWVNKNKYHQFIVC